MNKHLTYQLLSFIEREVTIFSGDHALRNLEASLEQARLLRNLNRSVYYINTAFSAWTFMAKAREILGPEATGGFMRRFNYLTVSRGGLARGREEVLQDMRSSASSVVIINSWEFASCNPRFREELLFLLKRLISEEEITVIVWSQTDVEAEAGAIKRGGVGKLAAVARHIEPIAKSLRPAVTKAHEDALPEQIEAKKFAEVVEVGEDGAVSLKEEEAKNPTVSGSEQLPTRHEGIASLTLAMTGNSRNSTVGSSEQLSTSHEGIASLTLAMTGNSNPTVSGSEQLSPSHEGIASLALAMTGSSSLPNDRPTIRPALSEQRAIVLSRPEVDLATFDLDRVCANANAQFYNELPGEISCPWGNLGERAFDVLAGCFDPLSDHFAPALWRAAMSMFNEDPAMYPPLPECWKEVYKTRTMFRELVRQAGFNFATLREANAQAEFNRVLYGGAQGEGVRVTGDGVRFEVYRSSLQEVGGFFAGAQNDGSKNVLESQMPVPASSPMLPTVTRNPSPVTRPNQRATNPYELLLQTTAHVGTVPSNSAQVAAAAI